MAPLASSQSSVGLTVAVVVVFPGDVRAGTGGFCKIGVVKLQSSDQELIPLAFTDLTLQYQSVPSGRLNGISQKVSVSVTAVRIFEKSGNFDSCTL